MQGHIIGNSKSLLSFSSFMLEVVRYTKGAILFCSEILWFRASLRSQIIQLSSVEGTHIISISDSSATD